MANLKCSVYECTTVAGKQRMTRVDTAGRLKLKDQVRQGRFYLSYYRGKDKVWERAPGPLDAAKKAQDYKMFQLQAKATHGVKVADPQAKTGVTLSVAITGYLDDIKESRKHGTWELQSHSLREFAKFCKLTYVDEIEREHLLKFKTKVSQTRSPRTVSNVLMRISQFHRAMKGLDPGKGLITTKDVSYTETIPEIYTDEELEKFFNACDPYQHLVFTTFLQTGFRMQEIAFLSWQDIDFQQGTISVTAKEDLKFTPKTAEERSVKVPSALIARLVERREALRLRHTKQRLVFPTKKGNANGHFLEILKAITTEAGLGCGHCKGCQGKKQLGCERWFLHKFRATYATTLLRKNFDVATVQSLLGHRDLASTMRYLAPLRNAALLNRMDTVWA